MNRSLLLPRRRPIAIASAAAALLVQRGVVTHDNGAWICHDSYDTIDAFGNQAGRRLPWALPTHDSTPEALRTVDSTGAFLVGELERLDPKLYEPLVMVSYGRDCPMRSDVTIGDDASSFMQMNFAASGSLGTGAPITGGKAWLGKASNQVPGVDIDIGKKFKPLRPWGMEVKFTLWELESAIRAGRPIDDQKLSGLKQKHQMDIDCQVYVGDADTGDKGLLNSGDVTNVANLPNGAASSPTWASKTPEEILADVNAALYSGWSESAFKVFPKKIGLPPKQFGLIATKTISIAGVAGPISILKYIKENNICTASGQGEIEFVPMKWLVGAGVGGTIGTEGTVDRMIVYTQEEDYVRYPMTTLGRTPTQWAGMYQMVNYYCKLGVLEIPYPETIVYRDGL